MGLVHLYCGEGKGKTTAAAGLTLRMIAHGNSVVFVQFLKDGCSGESRILAGMPQVTLLAVNPTGKFSFQMTEAEKEETAAAVQRTFETAIGFAGRTGAGLLVLDEVCAAVANGFLEKGALLDFLDHRPEALEVVLTGRDPDADLKARADYISEIACVRHPYEKGIGAREGIEF